MAVEFVWDYPRPPRVEDCTKRIRILFQDKLIADTQRARRVLETSHPPVYYIPPQDIKMQYLRSSSYKTFCEWKGTASYYTVEVSGKKAEDAAWRYEDPSPGYESIQNYVAFYPAKMDACFVDEEIVTAQPGSFYGGWITKDIRL